MAGLLAIQNGGSICHSICRIQNSETLCLSVVAGLPILILYSFILIRAEQCIWLVIVKVWNHCLWAEGLES